MRYSTAILPASVLSDTGKQRSGSVNEDAGLVVELPQGGLYAVADGMGGHAAGELASTLALQSLANTYRKSRATPPIRLARAVQQANLTVLRHAVGEYAGMGTTLVALVVDRGAALLAHVGDSRAYLLRGEQLYRLTEDHSWVAEQVRLGHLSEDEARDHQWRSVVSNALGGEEQVRLELYGFPVRSGDRLLLCSDGLSGVVEESDLLEILSWKFSPQQLTQQLIDAANDQGGPDNITALVVDIPALPGKMPSYSLPARRLDGPAYLDIWLSQQRDTYLLTYLALGTLYGMFIALLLFQRHFVPIVMTSVLILAILQFIYRRNRLKRLGRALPAPLRLGQEAPKPTKVTGGVQQLSR